MAQLLITGGAGFIGSHTCLVMLLAGHEVVVFDNFKNSSPKAIEQVRVLAGAKLSSRLTLIEGDIRNPRHINSVFVNSSSPIEAVIHFAGLKAVGESVKNPLQYLDINVTGSNNLLESMDVHGCRTLVFSSSATVYGYPESIPIPETARVQPINPYGYSKAVVEQILQNIANNNPNSWRIATLRYFNPVGAHPSGLIGEDPQGVPNNLFPFITQVASGRRDRLQVFGNDWPTPDGTGVRDYIHVMDLAEGHLAALENLLSHPPQHLTVNLGTGIGASVLEVIEAFSKTSGQNVPYSIKDRRLGDAAISLADTSLAFAKFNWRSQRKLEDMCRDGWAWHQRNPEGYV